MRISSINNALSGFVRTARNTVAAGMAAASPMVVKAEAKAEQIIPRQFATTNTVVMNSWAGEFGSYMRHMGIQNVDSFRVKTNEMARVANADILIVGDKVKVGGVGDGDIISAQLLATDDISKPVSEWKVIDFVGREAGYVYDGKSAIKWLTEIQPGKNRFFKWIVNPKLDAKKGDFGTQIKFTDENGNVIPDFEY